MSDAQKAANETSGTPVKERSEREKLRDNITRSDLIVATLALVFGALLCTQSGAVASALLGDQTLEDPNSYAALFGALSLLILATLITVGPILSVFASCARVWAGNIFLSLHDELAHEKIESSRHPFRDGQFLGWTDITNFLENQKYSSLTSRIQRANMVTFPSIGDFDTDANTLQRIRTLKTLLRSIHAAIYQSGPAYEKKAPEGQRVGDEKKPIVRLLVQLGGAEWKLAALRDLRLALYLVAPTYIFWRLAEETASAPAISGWGLADVAAALFPAAAVIAIALLSYRAARGVFVELSKPLSTYFELAIASRLAIPVATLLSLVAVFSFGAVIWPAVTGSQMMTTPLENAQASRLAIDASFFFSKLGALLFSTDGDFSEIGFLKDSALAQLAAALALIVATAALANRLIDYMVGGYEYAVFNRVDGALSAPPELVRMISQVVLFLVTSLLLYLAILKFADLSGRDMQEQGQTPPGVEGPGETPPASETGSGASSGGGALSQATVTVAETEDAGPPPGVSELIPFSVFVALIGGILALSTREFLENYFSGIAFRVDAPFEEGDRVTLNGGLMAEVRKISVRTVQFYEPATNSLRNLPHLALAQAEIRNFSRPDLDYRKSLSIEVRETAFLPNAEPMLMTTPARAEALLLTAAMLVEGVQRGVVRPEDRTLIPPRSSASRGPVETAHDDQTWLDLFSPSIKPDEHHMTRLYCWQVSSTVASLGEQGGKIEDDPHEAEFEQLTSAIRGRVLELFHETVELYDIFDMGVCGRAAPGIPFRENEILHRLARDQAALTRLRDEVAPKAVRISKIYSEIADRLWNIREIGLKRITTPAERNLDRASLRLLTPPRVRSERVLTENGDAFWRMTLDLTLKTAEQSDEITNHINMVVAALWKTFELGEPVAPAATKPAAAPDA